MVGLAVSEEPWMIWRREPLPVQGAVIGMLNPASTIHAGEGRW